MGENVNRRNSVFEDMIRYEKLSCGSYYGPGEKLVYGSEYFDEEQQKRVSRVVLVDIPSGSRRVVTAGGMGEGMPMGEGNPGFSPDGRRILFLSVVPGMGRQLFLVELNSMETRQLTAIWSGVIDPLWSPDGSEILFASMGDADKEEEYYLTEQVVADTSGNPVVIEDFGYKFDGAGFIRPEHMHLWVVSVQTGVVRRISDGLYDYMHHAWSPDGKKVVCVSARFHDKKDSIASDLILIEASGSKKMERLTEGEWAVSYPNPVRPVFTPDGKYVIMGFLRGIKSGGDHDTSGYPPVFLHKVALDGSSDECLMEETDECYDGVQFPYNAFSGRGMDSVQVSSDGEYVYFLSGYQGQAKLFKVNLNGESHQVVSVLSGEQAIGGIGLPHNGKMLVALSKPHVPETYYLLQEDTGELKCLVQSNTALLHDVAYSRAEDFRFRTLDGESMVHGWVLPPQNAVPGRKYPCILYIHGGPHPFYTYGFTHEFQCFAGAGYGVMYCNPRGSSGYGSVHRNLARSTDGSAYMDCLQFVEEAVRRYEWIDGDRLGVTGGSYGGYMTNYIAVHGKRFKAYITQRSVVNELIGYASSDMQGESLKYHNFEEFMVSSLKDSVISYVERVNAPFLILHGMEDLRTPVEGAHQLFVALKDLHPDLPVKMVLYPHVGHDQPSHPRQALHYYREMLNWFDKYL